MGAPSSWEPHLKDLSQVQNAGHALGPKASKPMGSSESPKISLVTTSQKAPAWTRSLFNLDTGFKGLMLIAGLTVLALVGLIVATLMQQSSLAGQRVGSHVFPGYGRER